MQVETYEIEEMKSSEATTMAVDSEALELCHKLGLTGQQKLSDPNTATRFPYPRLTSEQSCVYSALFPAKVSAKHYSAGIIPLRVLQVMDFCKDFSQTAYLEIWHSGNPKEDPILVGRPSEYSSENYLLARWGDALPDFDTLKQKALPIIRAKVEANLQRLISKANGVLHSLDAAVQDTLENGQAPSFYCSDLA